MTGTRLTPVQANATLPLVRAIVADMVDLSARLARAEAAYKSERRRALPSQTVLNDVHASIRVLRADVAACAFELHGLCASVEDAATGVVDFAGDLDGAPVLLCWKLGEEHVESWHGIDETEAQRRPFPVPVPA